MSWLLLLIGKENKKMESKICTRELQEKDIPAVCGLYEQLFLEQTQRGYPFSLNLHDLPSLLKLFIRSPMYKVYVAVTNIDGEECVVGYATGILRPVEKLYEGGGNKGYVSTAYLMKEHRGGGAADLLLDQLEDWFKASGTRLIELDVMIGNVLGRRYWKKRGYQELEIRMIKSQDV